MEIYMSRTKELKHSLFSVSSASVISDYFSCIFCSLCSASLCLASLFFIYLLIWHFKMTLFVFFFKCSSRTLNCYLSIFIYLYVKQVSASDAILSTASLILSFVIRRLAKEEERDAEKCQKMCELIWRLTFSVQKPFSPSFSSNFMRRPLLSASLSLHLHPHLLCERLVSVQKRIFMWDEKNQDLFCFVAIALNCESCDGHGRQIDANMMWTLCRRLTLTKDSVCNKIKAEMKWQEMEWKKQRKCLFWI